MIVSSFFTSFQGSDSPVYLFDFDFFILVHWSIFFAGEFTSQFQSIIILFHKMIKISHRPQFLLELADYWYGDLLLPGLHVFLIMGVVDPPFLTQNPGKQKKHLFCPFRRPCSGSTAAMINNRGSLVIIKRKAPYQKKAILNSI